MRSADEDSRQLHRILDDAGAIAYLDVPAYEQRRRTRERDVIVESTGAGGS